MPSVIRRLIAFAALSNLAVVPAHAQRGGTPAGQDYTIHNFKFASGASPTYESITSRSASRVATLREWYETRS